MALDLYVDGVLYTHAPQPVQAQPPQVATPASSVSSSASAPVSAPTASAAQVAAANQPAPTQGTAPAPFTPTGIQQFALQQGNSFWALLAKQSQSVVDKNALSDDAQLKQNLAATPWLDQQAFGNRPANKPCTLDHMPIGGTVTLLDSHRLTDLEQQRSALADAEHTLSTPAGRKLTLDDRDDIRQGVVNPIVDEIVYASGNGVTSSSQLDQIVAPIAARAPDDPLFQSAVARAKALVLDNVPHAAANAVEAATANSPVVTAADVDKVLAPLAAGSPNDKTFQAALATAKQQVLADMKAQGRTPEQLGQLVQDAASGNTDQLQGDLQAQLYCVGEQAYKDTQGNLTEAMAAIANRSGVYASYLDPKFKDQLQKAVATATQQVTVEQPAQSVVNAYNEGLKKGSPVQAAAAAAHQLQQLMDLSQGGDNSVKITPAQAQAIMDKLNQMSVDPSSSKTVIKSITDGLAQGVGNAWAHGHKDSAAAQKGLTDLAAALQTVHDSDGPPSDTANGQRHGKEIVDQVSKDLYQSIESNSDANSEMTGEPDGWVLDSVKKGDVAMWASITAQFAAPKQNASDSIFLALSTGLQDYHDKTLVPLGKAFAADYGVLDMGNKGYGNLKTASELDSIKGKIRSLPGDKTVADDNKLVDARHYVGEVQWTLQDYATQVAGPGKGSGQDNPALLDFNSLMGKVGDLQKGTDLHAAHDAAANVQDTQSYWQTRVGLSVANQALKFVGNKVPSMTSNDTVQAISAAILGSKASGKDGLLPTAISPSILGPMFLLNASNTYSALGGIKGFEQMDFAGFAAVYAGVGVNMTLDAALPNWKETVFKTNADGKALTPMQKMLDRLLPKIEAMDIPAARKLAYKSALSATFQNFSDVLGPIVAAAGAVNYLTKPDDLGHATAFTLATFGDLIPALAKQGLSSAAKDAEALTRQNLEKSLSQLLADRGISEKDFQATAQKILTDRMAQHGTSEADLHAWEQELKEAGLSDQEAQETVQQFMKEDIGINAKDATSLAEENLAKVTGKDVLTQMAADAAEGSIKQIGLQLLAESSADGWTGVGLGLNVLAAGTQLAFNMHDTAHATDAELTNYLIADGVRPDLAKPLAEHKTLFFSGRDAGAYLTAYARSQGMSDEDFVKWLNKIPNADAADDIATFAKDAEQPSMDKDGQYTLDKNEVDYFQGWLKDNHYAVR